MELRQNTPDALVHFSDYLLERYGLAATMQVALVASLAFHAVAIVGLGFKVPDPRAWDAPHNVLDVVLVNAKSATKPVKADALAQALASARPGGRVGVVGVPHGVQAIRPRALFNRNIGVSGGVAPVRAYTEELLADVRAGSLDPSPVFDLVLPLAEVGEAYAAMDERRAVKVMLRP